MGNAEVLLGSTVPDSPLLRLSAMPPVWRTAGWYVLTGCAALGLYMLRMLVHPVEMQWTMAWNAFLAVTPLFCAWLVERAVAAGRRWRWCAIPCALA